MQPDVRRQAIFPKYWNNAMSGYWVGADPGGKGKFGLAFLDAEQGLHCATVSSVEDAVKCVVGKGKPLGLGIDAPMWWSAIAGGDRMADKNVRDAIRGKCKGRSGTVQSPNSLQGAALIGGAMLAFRVRQEFPRVQITESHPKALLYALRPDGQDHELDDKDVQRFAERFRIPSLEKLNEHERDAAIAAVCAREGFKKHWRTDLARQPHPSELDPRSYWLQPMHYFWPEDALPERSRGARRQQPPPSQARED